MWGIQEFPDGCGPQFAPAADAAKAACRTAKQAGALTWRHILAEEVAEAFAEKDHDRLRAELDQAELADLLEVVLALAARHGLTAQQLEQIRAAKHTERGGFTGRVVWQRSPAQTDAVAT